MSWINQRKPPSVAGTEANGLSCIPIGLRSRSSMIQRFWLRATPSACSWSWTWLDLAGLGYDSLTHSEANP